jgi:hypothetical protein
MRAVVRLGKIYSGERTEDIPKGLLRYGRPGSSGMKLWPIGTVPVLIDHDEGKRIGTVSDLQVYDYIDGNWLVARCELYPDAPGWIRRRTPASFYSMCLEESSFVDGLVYGAYVREVSLLQREKPAEPGARVELLYTPEPKPVPRASRAAKPVTDERLAAYVEQRSKEGILVRPAIGQVLGVR